MDTRPVIQNGIAPSDPTPRDGTPFAPLDGTLAASLERSARLAAVALRAPTAVIALVGDDRRCFVGGATPPSWLAHDPGLLMRSGICRTVLESMQPVAVADTALDGGGDEAPLGAGAYVVVPLAADGGRARGIVGVFEAEPRPWTSEDIAVLTEHAAAAATELSLRRSLARRERMERKQRHEALHDALTGLPNRTLFNERLDRAIRRAKRREAPFAIILLDLDNFRVVNDSLGHTAGDQLLIAVARRLEACARAEDTVARLGGDEFALLLDRVADAADAARVAERAQAALATAVDVSGYEVFTSASFGIVLGETGSDRPDYLMRSADLAMGRAKQGGRARFAVFDPGMHADALARLQMETELRWAVEQRGTGGVFALHYQPIIDLANGRITGVEALVRWNHPERGLVGPTLFIPAAERTGLVIPLGRWVLTEGCRQVRAWHDAFPDRAALTLAVNVSIKQVVRPDFVETVASVLRDTGLPPGCLTLELTESVVIEQLQLVTGALDAVKRLGVRVHLDDFGMGYSSLAVLDRLPLDAIKIDRTFVGAMDREERFAQLVRTIVTLAQNVGLETIAEGVATDAHLSRLRALGCAYAQGFLFSPAVDVAALRALLDADRRW
ncbi:MAG TPA: EAL domain-containing protein [Gemmatimonadaceae bacterium]|nr:EAL domain-containing protein [Gemmatimonadaceae bacterium]